MERVVINGRDLSLQDLVNVARYNYKVELSEDAKEKIIKSRQLVDKIVEEERVVYGITTGFGKFSEVHISKEMTKELQKNLIISHACGVGRNFDKDIARAIVLLRANSLANGFSGVRLETVETLLAMINNDICPLIPEKGSLGASGDLAPLASMVLPMIGIGEVMYADEKTEAKTAFEKAGIKTLELTSKEGLALINGTQVLTAVGALTLYDALKLSKIADIATALTMEALNGITDAFDEKVHMVRKHKGQIDTGENILRILEGSKNTTRQGEERVQDAYSIRCVPQIHSAPKDTFNYVLSKVNIEINSVTDNPLIFPDTEDVISAGNFHGEPMALPFDFLGIALAELANVSERRLERLVNPALSGGLNAFLVKDGGVNSGYMIVQYAAAALVSENKVLAHPASVDSIPSSANQEDLVSMGTIAARKAKEILENTRKVLAMEIFGACQAIDLRGDKGMGRGTKEAYKVVRKYIDFIEKDKVMNIEINKAEQLIINDEILKAVEKEIGELK